ncbi:MAG: ABC transporter ATP-binding protein [Clostridiaceae bacterium]|nr:ABC transporter ATP-binding protein [Clostridiaceae bacterium]
MAHKENKPRFSENVTWTLQGLRLMMRVSPSYLPALLGQSFITAFVPMMQLFFSARILNELAGSRNIAAITSYVAATVLLSFSLASLRAWLTREVDLSTFWFAYADILGLEAEQFARMDFPHTENSEISEKLAVMDTKARGNGLGLINLYWMAQSVTTGLFSLIFAALLLTGMFHSNAMVVSRTFVTTPLATLLLVLLVAAMLVLNILFRRKEKRVLDDLFQENAKANTAASYYNGYIKADKAAKDIRLYRQGAMLEHIFATSFNVKSWLRFFFFEGRLGGFSAAGMAVVGGAVYLLIGLRALAGMYAVGSVVQYVGAVTALVTAVTALLGDLGRAVNNAAYIKPLLDFLNLPDLLAKGYKPMPTAAEIQFEFRDVSFCYPGSETYALKNLNMTLNANRRLAVVGRNGSGKTTLIKLLCRLYDPTEGEILLNGINIKDYDIAAYRRIFSVVFQDFKLFPLSIGANVTVSDQPDPEKIRRCLEDAGFGDRLATLPKGIDTVLFKDFDEDGVQISGGEAQKIALARALYKDAGMVVLDEPTAALDPIAEFEVYSSFNKTIGSKTAVFISHRLSSCRFCHDIAVFDKGELVQRGSHAELLAETDGLYAALWHAQAQHYVDEKEEASG